MLQNPLGNSGLMVSAVGLGCNNFGRRLDLERTRAVVDAALDAGVTLFDTADIYGGQGGSEELLGRVLEGRRDEVVLATKFGMDMQGKNGADHGARGSRRYIRRAVEASLRRLRTDHIDLYQYHEPDGITPVAETLEALAELVAEGKVRYVGCSNMTAWEVVDADWIAREHGWPRFISAQNEFNLLRREAERELLPACRRLGTGVLPYFPLASGLLTGRVRRGQPLPSGSRVEGRDLAGADLDAIERLAGFAAKRDLTLLQLAFGWLLAQPPVASVIAGATSPEQVRANVAAGEWRPDPDALAALDELV